MLLLCSDEVVHPHPSMLSENLMKKGLIEFTNLYKEILNYLSEKIRLLKLISLLD